MEIENHYLYISKRDDGKIGVNSSDGVFSSYATAESKEAFCIYCGEKIALATMDEEQEKTALEHPTGGELLHVLNKGHKQGYRDAIDKA